MGDVSKLIDEKRAEDIGLLLARAEPKKLLDKMIPKDPLFRAIELLVDIKGCDEAAPFVVANALTDYQTNIKGEEYWLAFVDFITSGRATGDIMNDYSMFLERYGGKKLEEKRGRAELILSPSMFNEIKGNWRKYCKDLRGFAEGLVDKMNEIMPTRRRRKLEDKTIAFTTKALGYLCMICMERGERKEAPDFSGIPIPLDSRNKKILVSSCVAERLPDDDKAREKKEFLKAFGIICEKAGVSCIELDIVLWPIIGALLDTRFDTDLAWAKLKAYYGIDVDRKLLEELAKCKDNIKKVEGSEKRAP